MIGLDMSLRSTGVAVIPRAWGGDLDRVRVSLVVPDEVKHPTERDYSERSNYIVTKIISIVGAVAARDGVMPVIYVEQYAFSKNNSGASRIMEVGGAVKLDLYRHFDLTVHTVHASEARKVFLGAGCVKAGVKELVGQAVAAIGLNVQNDGADAFVVANFGCADVGVHAMADVVSSLTKMPAPRTVRTKGARTR